jgi:nitrogen regulatory protein PII
MPAYPMKLVTIVCEALARDAVTRLLREAGAQGWTVFPVEGFGSKGERTGEMAELANVQIEVIVSPPVCERLMGRLEQEFFPKYGMIAFEGDIRVRRPDKF